MIATIAGRLSAIEKNAVIIEVGGLGLRVRVPETVIAQCGPVGSNLSLHTHLYVREDELTLYGCASADELRLFRMLLSVSGVGPKVALALLSKMPAADVRLAIADEQSAVLSSVPGIGAKTAKKIILDLKEKVQVSGDARLTRPAVMEEDVQVIDALTTLGYSVVEAQTALQQVPSNVRGVEERLRAALSYLGS